jgi:hypothetical protein
MEMGIKEDGTKFAIYPFEFDGYKFVSRVLVDSELYSRNLDDNKKRLYELNKNGSFAYIELADE